MTVIVRLLAGLLVFCLVPLDLAAQADKSGDQPQEKLQARESAEAVLKLASRYAFYADAARQNRFELQARPLLTYSNPIRGDVFGNVFVWTSHGRPEVVGAIFDFRSEDKFDSELHALARGNIVGDRDGREFWNPVSPGIGFQPISDGPQPAGSTAGRLRQMRDLARSFTVEREHPEQKSGTMRMLSQPIYRYDSAEAEIVDGAMFVFVEGTDPEAYLLLEATGGEQPGWQFAFARMNIVEFRGLYRGMKVWHVDPVSWDTVFDRQEPYAIVRESPQRGLVRSR